MNIVVLVKQVPDTYSERKLSASDATLDRDASDAVLDEINERVVEAALQLTEAHGGEVTNAPIFEIADYGVVGDLFTVTPPLRDQIEARGH